jgi:hypothetical protein
MLPKALAAALHEHHPPMRAYDPDDITTWDAAQLDELGLWQAAVDGAEVLDHPLVDHVADHAVTLPGEFTTITDWDDPGFA